MKTFIYLIIFLCGVLAGLSSVKDNIFKVKHMIDLRNSQMEIVIGKN